jgi:isoquinoline 1-oxidoreductase beta subunit
MAFKPSRRFVIFSGLAATGALVVGYALSPFSTLDRARRIAGKPGESMLSAWVRIAPDNSVTVLVPHAEMGQGIHTALPMMLAEELDADWAQVRMEQAPADMAFANGAFARGFLAGDMSIPSFLSGSVDFLSRKAAETMGLQVTGGSMSVRMTGVFGMRRTGAAARYMLVRAAAESWGVPDEQITVKLGIVSHAASGRSATFGELAALAATYDAPVDAPLKAKADYTIVGQSKPRFDVPGKVDGSAVFGIDVRLPGMLFAAALASPVPGGTLKSVDEAPALAVRGVKKVVKLDSSVVVVADNTWRAQQGLAALAPVWDEGPNAGLTSDIVYRGMNAALDKADFDSDFDEGDAAKAIAGAAKIVEAAYKVPFLAHATMEPMNATAHVHDGKVEIWGGFQDGLGVRSVAAELAGVGVDDVVVHHTAMGGGFGRRAFSPMLPDVKGTHIAQAIAAARAVGAPVQLVWSREEDMTQDFYREASVARMRAGLTADGRIAGWEHSFAERHDPPEATVINYGVADRTARFVKGTNPMPWGPWRSVDHTQHGFYIESFMDELAHAAGQDPLAFRLTHLGDAPRHKAALEKVAAMAGWGTPPEAGRARGIAMREAFGTIVAQVAEVSVGTDGRARVHRMWSAVDPGEVIHPANFKAQIVGGAIYGLTAALYGEISIDKGRVQQTNFHDYEMVRMADAPLHEVAIIESGAKTGGAGEPGTAPVAAAVANALFALTGKRLRELPLRKFNPVTGAQIARA